MKDTVLVGGSGFIGRNLVPALIQSGREITVTSRSNCSALFRSDDCAAVSLVQGTLEQPSALHEAIEEARELVLLACPSKPGSSRNGAGEQIHDHLNPLFRFLTGIRSRTLERVVFLSSGGTVYGDYPGEKASEGMPLRPRGVYGAAKASAELFLRILARERGWSLVILRPSNPVGRFQVTSQGQGVVPAILGASHEGREFTIFGDGCSVRDYFHVEDLVSAIIHALHYNGKTDTFNLGSGTGRTVLDLIALVEKISGRTVAVRRVEERSFDLARSILDCSLAERELAWKATRPLEDAVADLHDEMKIRHADRSLSQK